MFTQLPTLGVGMASRRPVWLHLILFPLTSFNCCLGCITLQCPLIIFLIFIPFVLLIQPGLAPFGLFQFWGWWGSLLDIAMLFWPMLAVGLLLTLLNTARIRDQADVLLVNTRYFFFTYLRAGPLEELVYRWLFFYGALIYLPLVNFITFGLLQWSYSTLGSIADFFTFHQLYAYLFSSRYGWIVGQAILLANGSFRDGHSYQGTVGWIRSWFSGMLLFLIMFRHGLFAAMFVHSFYNLCVAALTWLIALSMTQEEA